MQMLQRGSLTWLFLVECKTLGGKGLSLLDACVVLGRSALAEFGTCFVDSKDETANHLFSKKHGRNMNRLTGFVSIWAMGLDASTSKELLA